jgi:uncharacterized protein YjbI with pentapeptide repeats
LISPLHSSRAARSLYLSDFRGTTLKGAAFDKAHVEGASFRFAHLEGAVLNNAHLEGARLTKAHLEGAFLIEASLTGAWLNEAHQEGTLLGSCRLDKALLDKAHLESAWLKGANLYGASLSDGLLVDALLDGAYLGQAEGVAQEQIDAAWGITDTTLPNNCTRPLNERWLSEEVDADKLDGRWERWKTRHEFWRAEGEKRREAEAASLGIAAPEK